MARIAQKNSGKNFAKSSEGDNAECPQVVESNHELKSRNPPQRSDSPTIPPTDLF